MKAAPPRPLSPSILLALALLGVARAGFVAFLVSLFIPWDVVVANTGQFIALVGALALLLVLQVGSLAVGADAYRRHRDGWWVHPFLGFLPLVGDVTSLVLWYGGLRERPVNAKGQPSFL